MCLLRLVSLILAEISAHHLQLKCMGGHFFFVPSYIESTTVLSDIVLHVVIIFIINFIIIILDYVTMFSLYVTMVTNYALFPIKHIHVHMYMYI